MFEQLTRVLVTHRLVSGSLLAVLTLFAAVVASHVRFEFSPQAFYAGDDDLVTFSERHKARFGYEDAILVLVLEATGDADTLSAKALQWQLEVTEKLQSLGDVEDVNGIVTLELPKLRFLGGVSQERFRLLEPGPVDDDDADRVRRRVDRLRMLNRTMISEDRRLTTLMVFCPPELRGLEGMQPVARAVRDLLDEFPPPAGYDVHLTGLPALRVDIVRDIEADQLKLFPLSAVLFLIALCFVFRRLPLVFMTLAAVGTGVVWSVAGMVAMGQAFNLMSSILPTLLLIIGISNSVHIVGRFLEEETHDQTGGGHSAWQTMKHMCVVCLLTTLTTAIGFGSLLTARSLVLQTFAWQAAIGMACLFVSMVVTFSVLLPWYSERQRARGQRIETGVLTHSQSTRLARVTTRLGMLGTRQPLWAIGAVLVLIGGAFWVSRGVYANSSFLEMYDESHYQTRLVRMMERDLSGIVPLEIDLDAENAEVFSDTETFRRVFELTEQIRELDGVTLARAYPDLYQEVYAQFKRSLELADSLPDDDAALDLRIRVAGGLVRREAETVHLSGFMTDDHRHARVLIRMSDIGTSRTLEVIREIERMLATTFPAGSPVRYRLTGDAFLNAVSMDRFVRDLFSSLFCAALIIFCVIAGLFRSPRIGLIAVLPNLVPLVLTFGYIGLQGYELNAGNVIVFAISLGIGIDDTIHFLARFREEMHRQSDVKVALEQTLKGTGRAIVITSLLVVSGLGVLMLSDFVPTRRFAELTAVTMVSALAGVVLLLPPSLVMFWREPVRKPNSEPSIID